MTGSASFGEIWLCDFPFTSGAQGKLRPALVLVDLGTDVLIARVTSTAHHDATDLPVNDWQAAGLLKPSTVRLARLVTVEKTLLLRRLGALPAADRASVAQCWNRTMRLG